MHPLVPAYLRWLQLYKLVIFAGREDLAKEKQELWDFVKQLTRDGNPR